VLLTPSQLSGRGEAKFKLDVCAFVELVSQDHALWQACAEVRLFDLSVVSVAIQVYQRQTRSQYTVIITVYRILFTLYTNIKLN
jgi:hypothetical protein